MKTSEHGLGTVRKVRSPEGAIVGYRALLPRELSTPPLGCKNPERYQEAIGPLCASEDEARALLNAAIVELRDKKTLRHGLPISAHVSAEIRARHQDARRKYKTEARATKAVSTWRSIERRWLKHAPWLEWTPAAIETADVQRFVDWLRDEAEGASGGPLSGHFIRNVVVLVHAAFERARVRPNPASELELPPKGQPEIIHLELAAQRGLFGADEITIEDRTMTGCGMGSGLRVGELLAMEESGVRVEDRDPHLIVQFGGSDQSPTKGERTRRVELFEPGLGFWRLWMRKFYRSANARVFAGPAGGFQKHWPDRFPGWAGFAGMPRLTSHIMRHTYAVSMLSGSWGYEPRSLEFIQQQLGHAERTTTERFYGAFEAGTWRREVQRMTGRVVQLRPGHVLTALELLRLDASNDARAEGTEPFLAATVGDGMNPRHPPKRAGFPEENRSIDASGHHSLYRIAREALSRLAEGDELGYQRAVELCRLVVAAGDPGAVVEGNADGSIAGGRP